MADKPVKVEITGDSSGYKKALGEAEDATGKFAKSTGGHGKQIAAAGVAAAAGVGALAASAIDAASDYNETVSKAKVIFGEASASVIDFAENAADSFGLSQQAALDAEATFATFGKGAGLAGQDLSKFAQDLTGLAADMASFSNTSPEQAIEAIGAALRGEAEPIRAYGVLLDDATLKQTALELGIYSGNGALTQQQKVMAAQKAIFDQTSDSQGDFARTSDGLAGKQKILAAQFENTKIALGEGLIPIAIKAFDVLQKLAFGGDAPVKSFEKLADAADQSSEEIINNFGELVKATEEARSTLDQGIHGIGDLFSQVRHPFEGSDIENVRSFDKAFGDLLNQDPDAARQLVKALHDLRDASDAGNVSAQEWVDSYDLTTEKLKELDEQVGIVGRDTRTASDAFEHMGIVGRDTAAAVLEQAQALAETATRAQDAQRATDNLAASWDQLKAGLSDQQAWIDVQDSFDDVRVKGEEAFTAAAEKSDTAAQAARDYQSALIDLKQKVIDYANEVGGLPPEVVSKILADIDEGSVANAEALLDRIGRERQVIYNAQVAGHREFEKRAGGGPVKAGQIYMVGENGPELFASDAAGKILSNRSTAMLGDPIWGAAQGHPSGQIPGGPGGDGWMAGDPWVVGNSARQDAGGNQPGDMGDPLRNIGPVVAVAAAVVARMSGGGSGSSSAAISIGEVHIHVQTMPSPNDLVSILGQYRQWNGPAALSGLTT